MNIKKRRQAVLRRRVEAVKSPQAQPINAAQQCPQGPPVFLIQALDHVRAGRLDSAVDILMQHAPEDPMNAYGNLGRIFLLQQRFAEAQDALEKVFKVSPHSTDTAVNLAHALASQHQVDQAVETLLACLRLQHKSPAIRVLTQALVGYQARDAALTTMQSLHNRMPDNLEIQFERAFVLKVTGHMQEAEQALLGVLEKQAHMCVYYELARLYRDTLRPSRAITCLRQAVALNQDQGEQYHVYHELGHAYCQAGLADEGVAILRQALDKAPDDKILRSDFLLLSHTLPDATPQALFQGYQEWARLHAPASLSEGRHDNQPDPDRMLRIGYLFPDFCRDSVSCFIEPLLDGHHRYKVCVYGYGHMVKPEAVAHRIKRKFDHFCDIASLDDQDVARQIKQDGIDILVDLAGHTVNNRLGVMALKPAPVQVTYLGHPDTTGLPQIDYRITDARAESDRSRRCTTETLVELPQGFLCYRPPESAPEVMRAPFKTNGFITFGSFNNQAKVNRQMIALWSKILLNIPNARFLLKLRVADDEAVIAAHLECFEFHGIPAGRIDIRTEGTYEEYLACLGSVDIALDTYPYNGSAITCETLWMGVPVITLKGDLHCSRVGYSLLSQLSMEFLAVDTMDQYVTMACALACKPEAVSQMRDSMRLRMEASTLMKTDAFAGHVEAAYQHMWETWCQESLSQAK
jgi:predicted O-linked N-acetylglucosamine transferase (SPINDLY family)